MLDLFDTLTATITEKTNRNTNIIIGVVPAPVFNRKKDKAIAIDINTQLLTEIINGKDVLKTLEKDNNKRRIFAKTLIIPPITISPINTDTKLSMFATPFET